MTELEGKPLPEDLRNMTDLVREVELLMLMSRYTVALPKLSRNIAEDWLKNIPESRAHHAYKGSFNASLLYGADFISEFPRL